MEKNLILAGVGGQGILSIAYVIDNAALDAGFEFKQAEVHGMSQRGGAVQSNLRYADHPIHSDLIPAGKVDMILAVEPLEALRYTGSLKPDGWIVSSVTPHVNIPDYPDMEELLDRLTSFPNTILLDTGAVAKAAGNLRAQNMVAVGAASPLLDFSDEQLLRYVRRLFAAKGDKIVAVNERAYRYGKACGSFYRELVQAGVPARAALDLTRAMDPATVDPALAPGWAELAGDPQVLKRVRALEGKLDCSKVEIPAGE